jgi:hypothetical protein
MKRPSIPCMIVVCSLFFDATSSPGAEEQAKSAEKPNAVKPNTASANPPNFVLQVLNLHFLRAEAALPIVRDIFLAKGSDSWLRPRFAIDETNNRLIAWGDRETLREVLALIQRLDQQDGSSKSEPQTKVFEFRYIDPVYAHMAVQGLGLTGLHSVTDSRTKSLIVNGRRDAVDRVAKLVHVLDAPPVAPNPADVSIRVAWLVDKKMTALIDNTPLAPEVPADLADSIAGLRKKIGIGELRMATQMIANVASNDGSTFNLSGTALQIYHLELSGSLLHSGAENRLNVVFSATLGNQQKGERPICSLDTTCSGLIPGRPMIVGMTTVNSWPSVLVIELLPKDTK